MSAAQQTIFTLNNRVIRLERIIANIMSGCNPCDYPVGSVTYFNVVSNGTNTIVDNRFKGWDVALIAPDDEHPFNTGFSKVRSSNTITLTTPIPNGKVVTVFLFKAEQKHAGSGFNNYVFNFPLN